MAGFLHGIETLYTNAGGAPINDIPTCVIGIVGTAPKGPLGPTLITSDVDAAKVFGTRIRGYTIPYAVDAIFDHGGAAMMITNVASALAAIAPSPKIFVNDKIQVGKKFVSLVTVTNAGATTTYVPGVDYTLDADEGIITRLSTGAIAAGATVAVGYSWADPALVTPADIIGQVTASGARTGMQALLNAYGTYGIEPTIIIAPGYSPLTSVATEMTAIGNRLKAGVLIDAPIGATRDQLLAGRASGAAPVGNFFTSDIRTLLCAPHLKIFDTDTGVDVLEPLSQRVAGVIARTDTDLGFWYSPSNKEIAGVVGVERIFETSYTQALSDSNILNSMGILTYLGVPGGGLRTWGNRSAAFPAVTTPDNFFVIQRVRDIIAKGIRRASLQFIDLPINRGLIDAIRTSILAYLGEKTVQGALLPGSQCLFMAADNPPTAIARGQLTFTTILFPPPPAERIIDKQVLDIRLASSLVG